MTYSNSILDQTIEKIIQKERQTQKNIRQIIFVAILLAIATVYLTHGIPLANILNQFILGIIYFCFFLFTVLWIEYNVLPKFKINLVPVTSFKAKLLLKLHNTHKYLSDYEYDKAENEFTYAVTAVQSEYWDTKGLAFIPSEHKEKMHRLNLLFQKILENIAKSEQQTKLKQAILELMTAINNEELIAKLNEDKFQNIENLQTNKIVKEKIKLLQNFLTSTMSRPGINAIMKITGLVVILFIIAIVLTILIVLVFAIIMPKLELEKSYVTIMLAIFTALVILVVASNLKQWLDKK